MDQQLINARPYCPAVSMDAEDIMFLLYTSGALQCDVPTCCNPPFCS